MSEELLKQEEPKDEDVEAHRHGRKANEEPGSDDSDDVEAHRHGRKANEEAGSDDSDDVEAHVKRR
jgi:hypothetical protein